MKETTDDKVGIPHLCLTRVVFHPSYFRRCILTTLPTHQPPFLSNTQTEYERRLSRHGIAQACHQVAPLHASRRPQQLSNADGGTVVSPAAAPGRRAQSGGQREGRAARGAAAEPRRGHADSYAAAVAAVRPRMSLPQRGARV